MSNAAPWIAAGGGVLVAAVAGWWQARQAKVAGEPTAQSALNDGFTQLIHDLRAEVERMHQQVETMRLELVRALADVAACEKHRKATEHKVAELEARLGAAGLLDRRKSDRGRPDGGPDRRSTP